jgi:hypothetical protein
MAKHAATPPLGFARVYSLDPDLSVIARLSDQRPNVDQGYGGWTEVTRPRRSPLTTFTASPGLHLSLPLLLDQFARGLSVEGDIAALGSMATPTGANRQPPRVRVRALGAAVPYQDRSWVINDISWGDAEMNADGNRTRQQFTLALVEYVADVQLTEQSAAMRRRLASAVAKKERGAESKRIAANKGKPKQPSAPRSRLMETTTTTFGDGEDLLTIAARELGDANRWVEIAQLNGLRDPRAISEGQVLRLP